MRRRNKKLKKSPTNNSSSSLNSSTTSSSNKSDQVINTSKIKTEYIENATNPIGRKITRSVSRNNTDDGSKSDEFDLLIKKEEIKTESDSNSESLNAVIEDESSTQTHITDNVNQISSTSSSVSSTPSTELENTYLFIELKLISIDIKCNNYEKLEQKYLCIDSKALVKHIKKYIIKKMSIDENLFEVSFGL